MQKNTNAFAQNAAYPDNAVRYFSHKVASETDCSDVYADIKAGHEHYILVDVRSPEAFKKSHAVTAVNIPHNDIKKSTFEHYPPDTKFVVYCWGPGCNGATKAALKIATLGFAVKEMIGGIHYWEDFERYPVNRLNADVQR